MSGPRSDLIRAGSDGPELPGSASKTSYVLPGGLSFAQWEQAGRALAEVDRAVQWWVGDWLNYGATTYGEKYTEAVAATGYEPRTLRNLASVAKRVEVSRRRDDLSFSHHAEVAALEPTEQTYKLALAASRGWSVAELRRQIKGAAGTRMSRSPWNFTATPI